MVPASWDIVEGSRDLVTLHLYRWATGSYSVSFDSSNYSTTQFDNGDVRVTFTGCEAKRDWIFVYTNHRKNIGTSSGNGVINITTANSPKTGCKLSDASFTYHRSYNQQPSTASTGTLRNENGSWTASSSGEGNGDASVTISMEYHGAEQVNAMTGFTVNYGYWDF